MSQSATKPAASAAARAAQAPEAVPFRSGFYADDQVLLLSPVRILRKYPDGTMTVVGDGINRTVPARDLMRVETAAKGRGR